MTRAARVATMPTDPQLPWHERLLHYVQLGGWLGHGAYDDVDVDTPWLSALEAAAYLRAPLSRIRKLTSTRELPHHKDGRRVLYHRDELDAFIRAGGAVSP